MKIFKKISIALLLTAVLIIQTSCTDGFENMNINPESLPKVDPEGLFYTAQVEVLTSGHCWNSIYASKFRWMQYGAGIWGYTTTQYDYFMKSIGNSIYSEYNNMGSYVTHMRYLIENMPENEKDSYENLKNISRILLISKGIQASDMFGSLVYTEGWLAREGKVDDESMTPSFETQEELSTLWNDQLKECIAALKAIENSSSLISLKGHDRAYNGDVTKWIKAANGLRLRLATRLWKRKPDMALTIAKEVLDPANANYIFNSNDDNFILWFDVLYTNIMGGDWHSIKDMDIATYAIMDYLNKTEDPRKRMYFVKNNLTPENIALFNSKQDDLDKFIPEDFTHWEGSTASYDSFGTDKRRTNNSFTEGGKSTNMRAANLPQVRLWKGNDTEGNGGNWAPIMSFSDFCFLAAEFVLRENISSTRSAQEWYEVGVRSSLDHWNTVAKFCDVVDYDAMTETEISNFLNHPDIKWDPAKALEQIYAQAYIDHFKNVDESYAQWRRTGYPNTSTSTIIEFEVPYILGEARIVPRRVTFDYPAPGSHNYENQVKRIDVMLQDPQFGGDIQNEYGRLWWDAE